MSAFEQLAFLRESFLAFWEFGINFDEILQSVSSVIAYRQFLNLVSDEMEDVIRVNIQKNMLSVLSLFTSLDYAGDDCRHTGVIIGAMLRKLISI